MITLVNAREIGVRGGESVAKRTVRQGRFINFLIGFGRFVGAFLDRGEGNLKRRPRLG